MVKKPSEPPLSFENAVAELEAIVDAMEHADLPLEEALSRYQRGVELLRHCQRTLGAAEQRIRVLEGEQLADMQGDKDD
ncbi:MAG: exodeoxyribonuclease VII small subunit [Candidatus Dactylopiibacterium sp.]|nr:exodeoxyribonuclease VII small subunit [Candidatus Dactylopiibacterium sp.]